MIDERGPCEGVLKINDLVLEIKGKNIKNIKNFSDEQKKIKPDELIIIRIKRNRQELNRAIRYNCFYTHLIKNYSTPFKSWTIY